MRRYALRDDQWDQIKDLLPGREGHVGATAKDNRLFVEAVLYRYRAGIPWRDLPERFGNWNSVFQRFNRWSKSGVWARVFQAVQVPDLGALLLDSTIIRAHQHAAGAIQKKGTKRSVARGAVSAPSCTLPAMPKDSLSNCDSVPARSTI